jgi:hypothetical protein
MADGPVPHGAAPPQPESNSERRSGGRNKKVVTGLAFGIGSAALVAALLYANRKKDAGSQPVPQDRPLETD